MAADPSRLDRARTVMRDRGIDALLVGPSADLFWLIGYRGVPLERLTMLVLPAAGQPVLVVPQLEAPLARAAGAADLVDLAVWPEEEEPVARVLGALGAAARGRIAVQDRLWSTFLLRLQEALPDASWTRGGPVARELRIRKSPAEVDALRRAGAAIDAVHEQVPALLRPGRTEAEVGRDIAALIRETHDEVNFVIVASGPNGASPHHDTDERVLEEGDAVVVDIGGTLDGYCSDATRDYVLGRVPDGYAELHAVLEAAQQAGVEAVAPGVAAEDVDRVCRSAIADAGYGDLFIHRTGHGIGVEEHEDPFLVAGNREPLDTGMAFSVEPGIYVPGRYGARIEDVVVVADGGAERLNHVERSIQAVGA